MSSYGSYRTSSNHRLYELESSERLIAQSPLSETKTTLIAGVEPVEQLAQGDVEGLTYREEPVHADLAGAGLPAAEGPAGDAEPGGKLGLGPAVADALSRNVPRQERRQRLRHADIVERFASRSTPLRG